MLHTIKIPENDLKKIVAKAFGECKPENVYFSIDDGQLGEKIVYAIITKEEEV